MRAIMSRFFVFLLMCLLVTSTTFAAPPPPPPSTPPPPPGLPIDEWILPFMLLSIILGYVKFFKKIKKASN